MLEDAAFIPRGSAAGEGPAKRGHCTPDGPERPEEEDCPSPAGSTGSWTAGSEPIVCVHGRGRQRGMRKARNYVEIEE